MSNEIEVIDGGQAHKWLKKQPHSNDSDAIPYRVTESGILPPEPDPFPVDSEGRPTFGKVEAFDDDGEFVNRARSAAAETMATLVRDFLVVPREVDSMDDLQPVPRRGKFFGELITRGEIVLDGGTVVPAEVRDDDLVDVHPKRVRVEQLGPPPDEGWDFEVGWEVIVPYHAGTIFKWLNQSGVEECLFILDSQEVIALFRPRSTTNE